MKSLILKDLYNIGHNTKSLVFIFGVLAISLIPTSGVEGYIFACAISCSVMIITTFSFDEHSKWMRYAMITPISRKNLVIGKFIVLAIFGMAGSLFGLTVGSVIGLILKKVVFTFAGMGELLLITLAACGISLILSGMSIPLAFRFGAERGRLLLMISFLVPAAICFGAYQLLILAGVKLTEQLLFVLLCCVPVMALIWCYVMYRISYRIFMKQEL